MTLIDASWADMVAISISLGYVIGCSLVVSTVRAVAAARPPDRSGAVSAASDGVRGSGGRSRG